jgi:hypothetical protein
MKRRLIVVRFALKTLTPMALVAGGAMGQGQANSQWNTMGDDQAGWLTTSKDVGGDGPHGGGDGPRRG